MNSSRTTLSAAERTSSGRSRRRTAEYDSRIPKTFVPDPTTRTSDGSVPPMEPKLSKRIGCVHSFGGHNDYEIFGRCIAQHCVDDRRRVCADLYNGHN